MPATLPFAIALLAAVADPIPTDAAATDPAPVAADPIQPIYGPVLPAPPKPRARTAEAQQKAAVRCQSTKPSPDVDEIIICAERPQGYRLDPDVMAAKRGMRYRRPRPPETMRDNSCASVGPMGCTPGGVDLVGAALAAVGMAVRAARGENVGKMFVTRPEPTEYQLYLEAKHRREAEAEAAAKAKAKAAQAAQTVKAEAAPSR